MPASAASSSLRARAESSSETEGVPSGGVWSEAASSAGGSYGCSGVLSSGGSPPSSGIRVRPQFVQTLVPGSLYASQRRHTSPKAEEEAGSSATGASSRSGALQ